MKSSQILQLITKYASLLVGFYLLELMLSYLTGGFTHDLETAGTYLSFSSILHYGLNIVTAVIIYRDTKDLQLPTKYTALIALVYRPLGVVIFILYTLYQKIEEKKTADI